VDVWEYFESKRREVSEASLVLDEGDLQFIVLDGSGGQRGRVWGRIGFTERTFLQVSELVVVAGSGVHRKEYAYYLIIDGAEVWGYERDLTHDPAVHRHDRNHNREPCDAVSFKQVLEMAWETASEEDSWEPMDEEWRPPR
jgi:hypothetical protein